MHSRYCFFWFFYFALIGLGPGLCGAQTLTEKLAKEDPTKLVEQAKQNGDVVRGAILFHQGNMNCAKCHRPSAERDRIGPDISRLGDDVSNVSFVESILYPSKKIKEGYETVTVLTLDGETINGMIFKEDESTLIIRDREDVDKLITIARSDIDDVRPGKVSNMPDKLVDELKNRRQFLDLLKYVIDLKERGPEKDVSQVATKKRTLEPELNGLVLMQQYNCIACHDPGKLHIGHAKRAPVLAWSAKHLNPYYIERYIANPHRSKPGATMPNVLGHLDETARKNAAKAISNFLLSNSKNEFKFQKVDANAVKSGFDIFHSVGCVACHAPRTKDGIEQFTDDSIALGDISDKYSIEGLTSFIKEPLASRPSGHMPSLQLSHREAMDLANFLLQSSTDPNELWSVDVALADQGKKFFSDYGCVKCHTEFGKKSTREFEQIALTQTNVVRGCLSSESGSWPDFEFSEDQITSIRTAITKSVELSPEQQVQVSLKLFNCVACHDRGDFGGISQEKDVYFKTTNLNLGDQGRIPPTLTGVGAKLKAKWMRDVMVNGKNVRPYMHTRMPQYGEDNIKHLLELFQSTDQLPDIEVAVLRDRKETRKKGLELAGNKGLNCVACHTYKFKLSDTMPAVDLTEMAERLKKDWFYHYMLEPQAYIPNTVMPSFWPGGNAIRKDIEGSPKEQIEALWQYLLDGRQAGTPRGVVREPLEIVVTNEAKMLRRQYPGIGKRGIGVGYPGGVNLSYDAEQMRLASVWKGKFADPGGVWTGQGSGNVRPMGKPINLPKGPELDQLVNPWVVDDGRPPKHQFRGYQLDRDRRPTFIYEFGDVRIEDFITEAFDEDRESRCLRRLVTFRAQKAVSGLRFRLAAGDWKHDDDGQFQATKNFRIRMLSDGKDQIRRDEVTNDWVIPISIAEDKETTIFMEYNWDDN